MATIDSYQSTRSTVTPRRTSTLAPGAKSRFGRKLTGPQPTTSPTRSTTPTGRTSVPGSATPQAPSPISPSPQPKPTPQPVSYDLNGLETMLAGIEAQYGVNREQLLAGQGEASDLYRFILANLGAAQLQAESAVKESGISRGILRSGIAQEQQAQVANKFAQERSQAASQRDQQLQSIALMLQKLEADLNREKTNTAVNYANTNLGTEEALAQALQLV